MASSTDSSLGAAQKDVTREAKKLPATPSSPSTPAPTSHDAAKATAPAAPHTVATGGGPAASSGSKPSYSALSPDRRRLTLGIATAVGFFGPLAAGVYLPALPILETAFAASATAINATVSVFMATLAVAPLFWAARADAGGRRPLYLASMAIYILANVLLATVPAKIGALFVLRIVQAIGAAAGVSMGAGTVADITEPRRRAAAMSIVLLGPQLGPVLGPLIGGAISGNASWRWIFGFLAIGSAVLYVAMFFFLPETLRSIVGDGSVYAASPLPLRPHIRQPRSVNPAKFPRPPTPTLRRLFSLLRYPPIAIVSLNSALLFAAYYAMNVTFPRVFEGTYGFSTTGVGVAYLAPGLALVAGSLISGRVSDWHHGRYMEGRGEGKAPHPEHRLHLQIPGMVLSLSGVLMYGWFVQYGVHPAGTIVATVLAFGMTWVFIQTTAYLTESFKQTPATMVALASLFRNPAAAVAAAIVDPLISRMGIGWCFSGLAFVELVCIASVAFLMVYGQRMRTSLDARDAAGKERTRAAEATQ